MVGWHHQLNGHESEQAPGDGEGQESPACSNPWGSKESDMTERMNNNKNNGKEPTCQCRRCKRCGFDPWVGKIPCRRAWQPTPLFLPGESHGQRILVDSSPWGCKELDTPEAP